MKTLTAIAFAVAATSAQAVEHVNVSGAPVEAEKYTARFETGLNLEQELARDAAERRAEQEAAVVESSEDRQQDASWRIRRGEDAIQVGSWRIRRGENAIQLASWRIRR